MNRYEFYSRLDSYRRANPDENKKDEIKHYGITGQKWGYRRWQYADGRFNPEGKERYFGSGKKSNNGVSDYLNYKKNPTAEPAKEFGDFPGLRGLKKVAKNLKEFEFGSTEGNNKYDHIKDYKIENAKQLYIQVNKGVFVFDIDKYDIKAPAVVYLSNLYLEDSTYKKAKKIENFFTQQTKAAEAKAEELEEKEKKELEEAEVDTEKE